MIIPPINTRGKFTFSAHVENIKKLNPEEEFTVTSIRSIMDLHKSEELPYETIYVPIGLSAKDFEEDLKSDIPIVVFTKTNGDFFYIPADHILSMPNVTGIRYRGVILAVNLGGLPLNFDLSLAKNTIIDNIYDTIGIKSTVAEVYNTAVTLVTDTEDKTFKLSLANAKKIDKSNLTRYTETLTELNKAKETIARLEQYIKDNITH